MIAVTATIAILNFVTVAQTVRMGGSFERAAFQSIPSFGNNMMIRRFVSMRNVDDNVYTPSGRSQEVGALRLRGFQNAHGQTASFRC
jgi:hypothetical protein